MFCFHVLDLKLSVFAETFKCHNLFIWELDPNRKREREGGRFREEYS